MSEISKEESAALSRFNKNEITKYNLVLNRVLESKGEISDSLKDALLENLTEVNEFLPLVKTRYLPEMVAPLKHSMRLLFDIITKYPENPLLRKFQENLVAMHLFFTRFGVAYELSNFDQITVEDNRNLRLKAADPYKHLEAYGNADPSKQITSEILLEGVRRLEERNRQYQLSERKAIELSREEPSFSKKRKNKLNAIVDEAASEIMREY